MTTYMKDAVALGDLKNAALYFDHLVPVNLAAELMQEDSSSWSFLREHGARELLPPHLAERRDFGEELVALNVKTFNILGKEANRRFGWEPRIGDMSADEYDRIEQTGAQAYFDFIDRFQLRGWPLAAVSTFVTAEFTTGEASESPWLALSGIGLIDASNAPWEQIFEFRRDPTARAALRRLRLFAFDNYADKPRSFVEDDLLARLETYDQTRRQWGLESVKGALAIVLDSKLAAGALAGTFVSALFGGAGPALAAAAAGVGLEVGHLAVELSLRRCELKALARESPVSYVLYAHAKLGAQVQAS